MPKTNDLWLNQPDPDHPDTKAAQEALSALPACSIAPWVSVDDRLPPEDEKVFFWLVAKEPHECPHDSSGNPITIYGKHTPHWHFCRWKCWGGLEKPTHWMPNLTPPAQ